MGKIAKIGSTTSHGGSVITGSGSTTVNGTAIARVGDLVTCPIDGHGTNPITSGSPIATDEGQAVARVGSTTSCGATITSGDDIWEVE